MNQEYDPRENPHWISDKTPRVEMDREELRQETDLLLEETVKLFDGKLFMNPLSVGQEEDATEAKTHSKIRTDRTLNELVIDRKNAIKAQIKKKIKKEGGELPDAHSLRISAEQSVTGRVGALKNRAESEINTLEDVLRVVDGEQNGAYVSLALVGIDKTKHKRFQTIPVLLGASKMFDKLLSDKNVGASKHGLARRMEDIASRPEAIDDEDVRFIERLAILAFSNAQERVRAWSEELNNLPVNLEYARKYARELQANRKGHEEIIDTVTKHDTRN